MSQNFEVDSLKIRIPISKVKILNPSLEGTWLKVNSITGEVLSDDFDKNNIRIEENGIKTKYLIRAFPISFQNVKEFLFIQINSKLLKQNYFEGINKTTAKQIYKELMSQKVVKFSYEEFIKAECTDVDLKKDKQCTVKEFTNFINNLESLSKNKDQTKKTNRKNNKGIQFSKRETTQLKYPFFKIYWKFYELVNNSKEFYENFLHTDAPDTMQKIYRIEYTVKNKKHFRKFGIDDTSLNNILNLSEELKEEMFEDTVKKHLDIYDIKPVKMKTDLIADQKIKLNALSMLMQTEKYTLEKLVEYLLTNIENDSQKRKKKKELTDLYVYNLATNLKKFERAGMIKETVKNMLFG